MKKVYLGLDAHARNCVLGSKNSQGKFLDVFASEQPPPRLEELRKKCSEDLSASPPASSVSVCPFATGNNLPKLHGPLTRLNVWENQIINSL